KYLAPILVQKWAVKPSNESTLTLGSSRKTFFNHCILVSYGNRDCFWEFVPIATTIWSNSGMALRMMSACPVVIGSNEPGKTAIFIFPVLESEDTAFRLKLIVRI